MTFCVFDMTSLTCMLGTLICFYIASCTLGIDVLFLLINCVYYSDWSQYASVQVFAHVIVAACFNVICNNSSVMDI